MRDVILGVPIYKNADLINPLVSSIAALRINQAHYRLSLIFVIDSPDDEEVIGALKEACKSPRLTFPVETIINPTNVGFVLSANVIINKAIKKNADLVLVNSDVVLFENTIQEMLEVAELDPMVGFVSPRTNDTTICTLPISSGSYSANPTALHQQFLMVAPRLPRVTYVPTTVGFCLLIKSKILKDFGGFDPIFGFGYEEENDLIMRANRCSYCAVIANWAFAYHKGEASFALLDGKKAQLLDRNRGTLAKRYPYYSRSITDYFQSPLQRALLLISKLADTRPSVAFDFSSFGIHKNGTTEYGTNVIRSFVRLFKDEYEIFAICSEQVWLFHEFDKIEALGWSALDDDRAYAAVVRLGQPFDMNSIVLPASKGAVVIFSMLDTIAYDCLHLTDPVMTKIWQFVAQYSDAIVYISAFGKDQLARRFRFGSQVRHAVCMPSTDIDEYKTAPANTPSLGGYFLIVGNHFAHKAVHETVQMMLRTFTASEIRVLGIELEELQGQSFNSGFLDDVTVRDLYLGAKIVIFPSHCEGFGFPVLHALANGKVVFVRDLPCYHEIKERVAAPDNIRFFQSNEELCSQLIEGSFEWQPSCAKVADAGWDRTARETEEVLKQALGSTTAQQITQRLENLELLKLLQPGEDPVRIQQEEELVQSRAELAVIKRSRSWRITAPLRRLTGLLRTRT